MGYTRHIRVSESSDLVPKYSTIITNRNDLFQGHLGVLFPMSPTEVLSAQRNEHKSRGYDVSYYMLLVDLKIVPLKDVHQAPAMIDVT